MCDPRTLLNFYASLPPSLILASVNLWPLTLQECQGGEMKHVLTVKQIPSLFSLSLHSLSLILSYMKVNCSDLSSFILSLSPSAFYLSPDVYLSHSLSFRPSPRVTVYPALTVYLFISFLLSVPDSFSLLVTIHYSDVCTAVLEGER